MLGKHFLAYKISNPHIKRHYTKCNVMKKEIYQEYLRAIKEGMETGNAFPIVQENIEEKEARDIVLTIEDYKIQKGLSNIIHNCNAGNHFRF